MYYQLVKIPSVLKTGRGTIRLLDDLLREAHLYFEKKILITQESLYLAYKDLLDEVFDDHIFVRGGSVEEAPLLMAQMADRDALPVAFGGGSVIDLVKYCADNKDLPFIIIPSALSNDAVLSSVSRLSCAGKKTSYDVQPPIGIIMDIDIIRSSPRKLILAGVADLVSNLSACKDWMLAYQNTGEHLNEMAYTLARQAALPMLRYNESDIMSYAFLTDLASGIITSGLSMMVSGNSLGTSGAEHLISHAIDEYFPEKSTIHGLQVGWAHMLIEKYYRKSDEEDSDNIESFFERIGLRKLFDEEIVWKESEFKDLIPLAMQIRNRYTIFNCYETEHENQ